ncbi:AEC family transporter [Hymenobacter weizhouensis]|uniref:AEC family transporter n=1 Tax=Hymenobacter sp. YIM 151500-1 TaxID=2987689 RepID=UPI002226CAD4|nr:AEC family transporter [Hymenobacter sp. YIM 151500-1]UYZ63134.1 transporter [Hymenobacter sp. YIM 151500-1]
MSNLLLLFVCLAAGAALRRWQVVAADAHTVLNQVLIWVLLPALTFLHLAVARFDARFLLPVGMPWLVFGAGWLFFAAAGRRLGLPRGTVGALVLTGGISSVSFVGFPVFELLYGRPGLELGIVMSLAGSMLICVTLGVGVGAWYGAAEPSWRAMGASVLRFPPFVATLLAGLAHAAGYQHPPLVRAVLERLSLAYPVVALLSVGLQLRLVVPSAQARALGLGLAYKLGLAPLLVWAACQGWSEQHGLAVDLCVLGAAIGPMNTAAALAARYGLNPDLAAQMVGLGIPLSLPLLALLGWWLR